MTLSGKVEDDPLNTALLDSGKWDIYYSLSSQEETIDQTVALPWIKGSTLSTEDISKVKLIKLQLKEGQYINPKESAILKIPLQFPNVNDINKDLSQAVASAAFSTDNGIFIESNKITYTTVKHYLINGKVFLDQNKDGVVAGQPPLAGYTVTLLHNGQPVLDKQANPLMSTTDENGEYSFSVPQRGNYSVRLEKKVESDQVSSVLENNDDAYNNAYQSPDNPNTLISSPFTINPFVISNTSNIYEKPSSMVATRNFGIVPQNGQITLKLVDDADRSLPISGATYALLDQNDSQIATFTTNERGKWTTDYLPFGNTYKIKQLTTTSDYIVNTEEFEVNVESFSQSITTTNVRKKGQILITLTDDVDTTMGIPGASFELINSKGELVSTLTTNERGQIIVENLPYGDFTLKQISTASDRIFDTSKVENLKLDGDSLTRALTNILKKGTLNIDLADSRRPDIKLS